MQLLPVVKELLLPLLETRDAAVGGLLPLKGIVAYLSIEKIVVERLLLEPAGRIGDDLGMALLWMAPADEGRFIVEAVQCGQNGRILLLDLLPQPAAIVKQRCPPLLHSQPKRIG